MDDPIWRERVDRELGGAEFDESLVTPTREGIDIRPLYARATSPLARSADPCGMPGSWPFVRGASLDRTPFWRVAIEDDVDPAKLNEHLREDLASGADTVLLRFDRAGRLGLDAGDEESSGHVGKDGAPIYTIDDLDRAFDGVAFGRSSDGESTDTAGPRVRLDAGSNALVVAAAFAAFAERRAVDLASVPVHFGADPIGSLHRDGWLPGSLETMEREMVALAHDCDARLPLARAVTVSTRSYHLAGAHAALELGLAMASYVHYVRRLTAGGLSIEAAANQIVLELVVGRDVFMEIAKLRAARLLVARILRACGVASTPPAWIFAETSYRTLSTRDPWINLLRTTTQCFAAVLGGADAVACLPFDAALGRPSALGRRIARNTLSILAEESHLASVLDPAGGSFYVESLTDSLARRAWDVFREVEGLGGIATAIDRPEILDRIMGSQAELLRAVEFREEPIVGVSEYPDTDAKLERLPQGGDENDRIAAEKRVRAFRAERSERAEPIVMESVSLDACAHVLAGGTTFGELSRALRPDDEVTAVEPLVAMRDAESFEVLRDAADRMAAAGARPTVFLANLGPLAEHKPRATFARHVFLAAGFDIVFGEGTGDLDPAEAADRVSDAVRGDIACVCGSDERNSTHALATIRSLRSAGLACIVYAAAPADGTSGPRESILREAGVDHFIHAGCNVWSILSDVLSQGVLGSVSDDR